MRLFIRILPNAESGHGELESLEWLLLDRAGALVSSGTGDPAELASLVDLAALQGDVVLLVPAEDCLSMRCTVPGRTVGQMRRALPFVVEEFLAGDLDAMHIAPGPVRRGQPVDVVLIERQRLQRWIDGLAAHGIVPRHATPDAALLPRQAGEVALLFDGGRLLVRAEDQVAATDAGALRLVLESFAAKATAGMRFVVTNGHVPEMLRAEIGQTTAQTLEWSESETDVTAMAYLAAAFPGTPPVINLLQGALAPPKTGTSTWSRWRAVAALLGIWIVVLLTSEVVRGAWASHRATVLSGEVEALYRSYFPNDQRIQDPYKQMTTHLGGRNAGDSTFLSLLAHLASGVAATPGAQLRSITFNDARAELGAEVAVGGFDALELLKSAWHREGVGVEISSAEQQDRQVHARIRLKGN